MSPATPSVDLLPLFEQLFDLSAEAIILAHADGRIVRANACACRLFGRSEAEVRAAGRGGLVVDDPALRDLVARRARAGAASGTVTLRRPDGTTFPADVDSALIPGDDGELYASVIFRDVSARVQYEAELHALVAAGAQALWETGPGGEVVADSPSWRAYTGQTYAEWTGRGWLAAIHPEDRAEAERIWRESAAAGRPVNAEARLRRADGSYRWSNVRAAPVRGPDGAVVKWVGINIDVSEAKAAEAALRASEVRFRTLADSAPVGIYEADAAGNNVYTNPAGLALLGLSLEENLGPGWTKGIHPEDRERISGAWAEAVAAGRPFEGEYRSLRPDGTVARVHGYGAALKDVAGHVTGYIGVMVDVTARRQAEHALAVASRRAALTTLIAGVAHEVNNPLTAIQPGLRLALEAAERAQRGVREGALVLPRATAVELDDAVEALRDSLAGALRIERVVKEMSALVRAVRRPERLRLAQAVAAALDLVPLARAPGASVSVEDLGAPEVMAAPDDLAEVLANLISNALKATRAGEPAEVRVRLGTTATGGALAEVTDRGEGMTPEVLERVFDPFFTTRQVGPTHGLGLGLAVCQAIVTSLGGALTATSAAGRGSTFRVELPAAPAAEP